MEQIKVIKHTDADTRCLENVVNYPIGKDQILKTGFGVDPYNTKNAVMAFTRTAEFFENENKSKVFHYVISFTNETAPTAESAMELAKKILKPITDNHLAVVGVHSKERDGGSYHVHAAVSPTNFRNGSMLYCDNRTNYALAQSVANVTGQPSKLSVRYDVMGEKEAKEWSCGKIFIPMSEIEG